MARLSDLTECWRSRNRGLRERHENKEVLVQAVCLAGQSRNDFRDVRGLEPGRGKPDRRRDAINTFRKPGGRRRGALHSTGRLRNRCRRAEWLKASYED